MYSPGTDVVRIFQDRDKSWGSFHTSENADIITYAPNPGTGRRPQANFVGFPAIVLIYFCFSRHETRH
jgi:hypothetical protein